MTKYVTILLILAPISFASKDWHRLQNEHFEVITDAPASGLRVIRSAERIRTALFEATGSEDPGSPIVRILVFGSDEEFALYQPIGDKNISGFYHAGNDRDYIVIRASAAELDRVVFHEYAHLFLHRRGARIPLWFDEGAAEVFSNARFSGRGVEIGSAIAGHVALLAETRWGDWQNLLIADRSPLFYAESWAMVHMLTLGPQYRPKLNKWLTLLVDGMDYSAAFEKAYGKTPQEIWNDLHHYLSQPNLPVRVVEFNPRTDPDKSRIRNGPDDGLAIAELAASLGKVREARRMLVEIAAAEPRSVKIMVLMGDLAMGDGDPVDALAAFSRAIDLGSSDARLYVQRALLERDSNQKRAISDLKKALSLDSSLEEARHLLMALEGQGDQTKSAVIVLNTSKYSAEYSVLTGTLIEFDCAGPTLVLQVSGRRQRFQVDDPAAISVGAPDETLELACGKLVERDVRIEYVPGGCGEGCSGFLRKLRLVK